MEKKLERRSQFKGEITASGILRIFEKQIARSERILDVGAGNGFLMETINQTYDKKAVGIDAAPESESVIKADIKKIPFDDDYFQAILCTDVIEHLDDETLDAGLPEICRVLAPNGKALFTTLLEEDLEKLACRCTECGHVFHRVGHLQTFTRHELESRMTNAGFRVEQVITTHLGSYSQYHLLTSMIKQSHMEAFLPKPVKKFLNKDIIIICSK